MEVIEIPIASFAPHFVQENEVFGEAFHFEFEWIERQGFWLIHITDGTVPLALGIKLQPDWPIYTHHEAIKPITFMLLAKTLGQILNRQNLSQHFVLVACEAL